MAIQAIRRTLRTGTAALRSGSDGASPSRSAVCSLRSAVWFVTLVTLFCTLALSTHAATVIIEEDWTEPGTGGWSNALPTVTLSNPGGYLNMAFPQQHVAFLQQDAAVFAIEPGWVMTNMVFRFRAFDTSPSLLQAVFRGRQSGRTWHLNLPLLKSLEWVTYEVPLQFASGWTCGVLTSEVFFLEDLQDIEWLGLQLRRHGSTVLQNYGFADMLLTGWTGDAEFSVAGMVLANSRQGGGAIRVLASAVHDGWDEQPAIWTSEGAFRLNGVPAATPLFIIAYQDVNGNGQWDWWEPTGVAIDSPLHLAYHRDGVNIMLTDPVNPDGVPYWWMLETFADLQTERYEFDYGWVALEARRDRDGSGLSVWQAYVAGVDPDDPTSTFRIEMLSPVQAREDDVKGAGISDAGVVLQWSSVEGRIYSVWRSSDLMQGFEPIATGIHSTPPHNTYRDTTATGEGPYFYRISVR